MNGIPIGDWTPLGALCAVLATPYILIAWGKLQPRRNIEDVIHDRDEWRAAHRISETARLQAAEQVDELLEHARTTDAFIRSLGARSGGAR